MKYWHPFLNFIYQIKFLTTLYKKLMRKMIIEKAIHNEMHVLCLKFKHDEELEEIVRKLPDCRWCKTMRCWYLHHTPPNFRKALATT